MTEIQGSSSVTLNLLVDEDQRAMSLRQRMHNPLCGLLTSMGFLTRTRTGARILIGSGELTGVHFLNNQPPSKPGSFHLGGSGVVPFESHIRVLAESLERYAGYAAAVGGRFPVRWSTWTELEEAGGRRLEPANFEMFEPEQLRRAGFPFEPFSPAAPIGWLSLPSLVDDDDLWVPAQWFLLGYIPQTDEPWMLPAVTTGTAAHTDPGRALLSGLEEVVQLDSAMGHWHGTHRSIRITHDQRTHLLQRVLERHYTDLPEPEFHLLPNADLPGFSVACLLRQPGNLMPRVALGLGSGARLVQAMYRSLLEAAAVQWLAVWVAIEDRAERASGSADLAAPTPHNGADIYDLESNVGMYAGVEGSALVERRYGDCDQAAASDLPSDGPGEPKQVIRSLVNAFRDSGKQLCWADLSTVDITALGFTVMRVWSPDTLSLSLPGAPPRRHRRFAQYGGFRHVAPHPYP